MALYDQRPNQVLASAARRGLVRSQAEAELPIKLGRGTLRGCERVAAEPGAALLVHYPRRGYRFLAPSENPPNAWVWRCEVAGRDEGILAGPQCGCEGHHPGGRTTENTGSAVPQGYTPSFDATVASRVLDHGVRIVGVAAPEDMCLSGASVSAVTGQVRNPRDPTRSAGGSSSAVAALIGSGAVDVGIGADQGGSTWIPASLSGVFGMKPTHGLVPYTGCAPIDPSLDHLGPMAGSVPDLARLLQAIAGYDDGLDPRQQANIAAVDYLAGYAAADRPGLRMGVLSEGFDHPGLSDAAADDTVRDVTATLSGLGAQLSDASIPLHRRAMGLLGSLLLQGAAQHMIGNSGVGPIGKGFYDDAVGSVAAGGMAAHLLEQAGARLSPESVEVR